ncbi:TPA: hypothetical protein OOF48_003771, partial [Providencia rettgeri]|nr:hypothetical protein [Providencia rettgeri]
MNRLLDIFIDEKTWPKAGKHPKFPSQFHTNLAKETLNIPAMLWMIGYLTTPTSSSGVSLSEFWAWIRYFSAITNDTDNKLRLTKSFANLDPHQKTILSDDFGMGVPMIWLMKSLSLNKIVDGKYFLEKYAASLGAKGIKSKKRGPSKTPDFIARDKNGIWHIIECKGTQSGEKYSGAQLENGIPQKKSIIFPSKYTGQRLVCGLSIGIEDKSTTTLKIIDPEPDDPLKISSENLDFAIDSIDRGTISKFLRISGLETSADSIASPLGSSPNIIQGKSRTKEEKRLEFVEFRNLKATEELFNKKRSKKIFDKQFNGSERTFIFPRDFEINGYPVNRIN